MYEPYLNMCHSGLRQFLTKIRLSSHNFYVERGRWERKKIPIEERTCRLCDVIEDEFHVMIKCPMYASIRGKYVPESLKVRPSMYEFVKFLSSKDYEDCMNAAILCKRVMTEYRKYL